MRCTLITLWVGTVLACALLLVQASEPGVLRRATEGEIGSAELLQTLVARSLRVADEEDPLVRARSSNDLAAYLTRAIARANERGDMAKVVRLGRYLSKVLSRGVAGNVAQLDPQELQGIRKTEWQAVSVELDKLSAELQRELIGRPVPPPSELRRTLDQSRAELEELWRFIEGKSKGKKGKDKGRKGKDKGKKGKKGKAKDFEEEFFKNSGKAKKKGKKKYEDEWFEDWPQDPGKNKRSGKKAAAKPGREERARVLRAEVGSTRWSAPWMLGVLGASVCRRRKPVRGEVLSLPEQPGGAAPCAPGRPNSRAWRNRDRRAVSTTAAAIPRQSVPAPRP